MKKALLICSVLAGFSSPAHTQDEPVSLVQHIAAAAPQDFVLARCAGFFKAMMLNIEDPDAPGMETLRETVQWFLEGVVNINAAITGDEVKDVMKKASQDIDGHARFYLDRVLANLTETGQPGDELLKADQDVCLIIAQERIKE